MADPLSVRRILSRFSILELATEASESTEFRVRKNHLNPLKIKEEKDLTQTRQAAKGRLDPFLRLALSSSDLKVIAPLSSRLCGFA